MGTKVIISSSQPTLYRRFENYQWAEAEKAVKSLIRDPHLEGKNVNHSLPREKNILEVGDLLMISHLDELLSRETVYLAKHCDLKYDIVYGALIMPMGNLNFAFR